MYFTSGRSETIQEVCSAPQKYGSLWLKVQQHVRVLAAQCTKPLPRDNTQNWSLLKKVAGANTLRAVSHQAQHRHLVHDSDGATIARVASRCREAEYRAYQYPVQANLQRIN